MSRVGYRDGWRWRSVEEGDYEGDGVGTPGGGGDEGWRYVRRSWKGTGADGGFTALLPDEIVLGLVEPELDALKDKVRSLAAGWELGLMRAHEQNWLLDGFPRKASQAVLLDNLLAKYGDELNFVANLAVPDEVILERIEGTFISSLPRIVTDQLACRPLGSSRLRTRLQRPFLSLQPPYSHSRPLQSSFNPPKVVGTDDLTGEPLIRRSDDTAVRPSSPPPAFLTPSSQEIFAKRLSSYHAENDPLLSHYSASTVSSGVKDERVPKLVTLKGRTSDEIFPQLEKVVEERFPRLPMRA